MQGLAVEIREKNRFFREEFGTKNALAKLVRNRWPRLTVECVRAEWDLTEAEARGAVYAQASQRTIDKIIKHPRGGWRLVLQIMEEVLGLTLADFITHERARLAEQQRRAEEAERALAQMASRLPALLGVGAERSAGLPARQGRPGRRSDRDMGDQRDREAR